MMIILIYIILYLPLSVLGVVTPKLLGEQNNYTLRNMVREYNNSNTWFKVGLVASSWN